MQKITVVLFTVISLSLTACGDDGGLGRTFEPKGGDDDVAQSPPYPIQPGETFWYFFNSSFRRTTQAGGGGLIEGEAQRAGHFCMRVTAVDDPWLDAQAATLRTQVKVVGSSSGGDIVYSDQANASVTPGEIDSLLAPQWLTTLTMPTRGHAYISPASQDFTTQTAISPPVQGFAQLPFFDPRESSDKVWGGWDGADPLVTAPRNYLNDFYNYFITTYSSAFFIGPDMDARAKGNINCEQHATDRALCEANQCTWDFQSNGCISLFSVRVAWREMAPTSWPPELQGPVVHIIRLEFNLNGSLRGYNEFIYPDTNTTADVSSYQDQCPLGNACQTSTVEQRTDAFSAAYCTF